MKTKEPVQFKDLAEIQQKLVDFALEYGEKAYCPYTKFPVGAAVLATNESGEEKIFGGFNIENASLGGSICSERTAITRALLEGYREIRMIAVACLKSFGGSPCGICRQFMREFGKDSKILVVSDRDKSVRVRLLEELLPESFGPETMA